MLEMYIYLLWYYKKVVGLRFWDGKMWMVVGFCLQKMGWERDGIKVFKWVLFLDVYYDVGSSFGGGEMVGFRVVIGYMDLEILL